MWKLTATKTWEHLEVTFPWVRDMKGVQQDPIHHAEGDVAVHTQMVLAALQDLPEYNALPSQEQEILWAAALLHDVEKRSTTVIEEDGSITSKGHARKGESTARLLLYREIPCPVVIREQIAKLVRYHGLPLWVFEKPDPRKAVIKASTEVDLHLLSLLAKADVLGRICHDQTDLLYRIDLFAELCKENDCFGKRYVFATDLAQFHYLNREEASPDYVPFDDTSVKVVVLSGLPGAGKDTYLSRHYPQWPVVSLDAIRREHNIKPTDKEANGWVVQEAKEQARRYLRAQKPFVWNATNITLQMRTQLIDLLLTYKAHVTLVYLEVPYSQLIQQNRGRDHVVPEAALEKLIWKLEVPTVSEAHEVVWQIVD